MTNSINVKQAVEMLNHYIETNKELQDNGQTPVAVCITGPQGIGKTDIVRQVAESRSMGFTKLSLHELEEVGDLIGYPIKEFKIVNRENKKTTWVTAEMLDKVDQKRYANTGETRMGYAKPAWVPKFNENGTILLLDDYARSSSMMVQATMELINTGQYVSWKLPKYTTIVLEK